MDAKKNQGPIRVLISSWIGYGHVSPNLELAKKLVSGGFKIYFCSTSATLGRIQDMIPKNLSTSIKLVPLILPNIPGLSLNQHFTNGLPPHLISKLVEAFRSSSHNFSNILADIKPDLLIYDLFQPWAPLLAKEHNIPAVHFVTGGATVTCFIFHYLTTPHIDFPFSKIYCRDYESINMKDLLGCATDPKENRKAFEYVHGSCDIILIKGCKEIEGKYMAYVTSLVGRKFVPVGPLVQLPNPDEKNCKNSDILSWLDKKEVKSTIFVSFGSECYPSKEDLDEIAYGLQLSGVNFIWVVRFPIGSSNGLLEETLPKEFGERVGDKGFIVQGWAPQANILGHPNIGGFVSHCGWNSTMESMYFGVPIIAMPIQFDQSINSRLVGEIGVGVEVLRDKNKRLDGEALAAAIKEVVIEDHGEAIRKKAADMGKKLRSKGDKEIDEVVKELINLCNNCI